MPGRIDILLPGLFHLPPHELDSEAMLRALPELNHLLRFASPRLAPAAGLDAALRDLLAIEGESLDGLPLAQAWVQKGDAQSARLQLFRAVHLRADLQHALLMPIPESDENLHDIEIIINDLSDLFKVDCDITAIADGLYLMRLREFDAPVHYPHLLSVLGKPANPYMEQSREHLPWYRLINEMQMFLHQHAVNTRRGEDGRLAINSLWCWGGGRAPSSAGHRPAWYGDDPLLSRFAASLGLDVAPLDDLSEADPERDVAVVDLRLLEALKTGAVDSLDALLADIDSRVIGPSLRIANAGRRRLRLRAGDAQDLRLEPSARLKFWRRSRTLAVWSRPEDEI